MSCRSVAGVQCSARICNQGIICPSDRGVFTRLSPAQNFFWHSQHRHQLFWPAFPGGPLFPRGSTPNPNNIYTLPFPFIPSLSLLLLSRNPARWSGEICHVAAFPAKGGNCMILRASTWLRLHGVSYFSSYCLSCQWSNASDARSTELNKSTWVYKYHLSTCAKYTWYAN